MMGVAAPDVPPFVAVIVIVGTVEVEVIGIPWLVTTIAPMV